MHMCCPISGNRLHLVAAVTLPSGNLLFYLEGGAYFTILHVQGRQVCSFTVGLLLYCRCVYIYIYIYIYIYSIYIHMGS